MTRLCLGCMEQYNREFDICPHCGYVAGTEAEESIHMEPGTTLEGRYVIGKVLGYGGFGVTYIGWDRKLEQKVAIKEYLPSEFCTRMPDQTRVTVFSGDKKEQFDEGLGKFIEEGKRLSKFQNEAGIVKIFDSFKSNATAYLIMEYLEGETLSAYLERIGNVSEEQMLELLSPVMKSLQVVHEAGILHRDISPDNLYVTKSGTVKLIDFGASRYATTSHSRSLTVIIKPGYSPEEQYRSRGDQGTHTDLYALASVMYKMLTGITPPDALERRAMIETKKKDLLKDIHKVQKGISPEVENAILNAMNVQIEDRTSTLTAFMDELYSKEPVKRRYGKIKKLDVYAWPIWLKVTLGSTLAAFLVTGILLVSGVVEIPGLFSNEELHQEGMIKVPDLEGMGTEEAIAAIEKLGLQALASGNVESGYIETGKIVFQQPAVGQYVQKGGAVKLTVSSGTGVVGPVNGIATMPYLVWNTKDEAITKLEKSGLGTPIIEMVYDNNVEEGKVVRQSVKENEKLALGTQVTIEISLGIKSDFLFSVENGKAVITGPKQSLSGSVVIPEKIGNYPVNSIADRAFADCTTITGIEISNGITSIGEYAFDSCIALKEVRLPESLTNIGQGAFRACISLEGIQIPTKVTQIEEVTFGGCKKLTDVQLNSGLTIIGSRAFTECSSLKQIELPDSLTTIRDSAFSNCSSLISIDIPDRVSVISSGAFYYCKSLVRVKLPSELQYIDTSMFSDCSSLTSIELPSKVTTIQYFAFDNCSSLKSITLSSSLTHIDDYTFRFAAIETVYFTSADQKQKFSYFFPETAQWIAAK